MKDYEKIENFIYQSVRESNLFEEYEALYFSILLEMMITKGGGIEEFLKHYTLFDESDLNQYYKDELTKKYGIESYKSLFDYLFGDIKWS